ncbi:hypothetical protein D3C81_567140 [compost metagenome]
MSSGVRSTIGVSACSSAAILAILLGITWIWYSVMLRTSGMPLRSNISPRLGAIGSILMSF